MLTKIRKRLQQEEGFTLIELLVVILIIGILAAVAIPTFLSQKNKANDSNAQSNVKNAQTIVESYANGSNGFYPSVTAWTAIGNTGTDVLSTDSDAGQLGGSGNPVYYEYTGTDGTGATDSYNLASPGSTVNSSTAWYGIEVTASGAEFCATTTASRTTQPTWSGTSCQTGTFPTVTP